MLLKVAGEERLVGEAQPKGDLLHGVAGGAEQHLDLLHAARVDYLLRGFARQAPRDDEQITCRDTEPVSVELHVALRRAVLE